MSDPVTRPGKMSRDRVHFTIPHRELEKRREYAELIEETLGIARNTYPIHRDLKIICRPSQFARFIILRHTKYGFPNNMACLDVKLVSPVPTEAVIDCSRNPNTALGEVEA